MAGDGDGDGLEGVAGVGTAVSLIVGVVAAGRYAETVCEHY